MPGLAAVEGREAVLRVEPVLAEEIDAAEESMGGWETEALLLASAGEGVEDGLRVFGKGFKGLVVLLVPWRWLVVEWGSSVGEEEPLGAVLCDILCLSHSLAAVHLWAMRSLS